MPVVQKNGECWWLGKNEVGWVRERETVLNFPKNLDLYTPFSPPLQDKMSIRISDERCPVWCWSCRPIISTVSSMLSSKVVKRLQDNWLAAVLRSSVTYNIVFHVSRQFVTGDRYILSYMGKGQRFAEFVIACY